MSTGNTQTGKSENAVQVRNSSPSPNGLKIKYAYRMRQAVKEKESGKRKERHGAGNGKGNGNEKRQSCNGEKTDCRRERQSVNFKRQSPVVCVYGVRVYPRARKETLLKAGLHKKAIAKQLGVCLATVYNELQRGKCTQKVRTSTDCYGDRHYKTVTIYSADKANDLYLMNQTTHGAPLKIGNDFEFVKYIEDSEINSAKYLKRLPWITARNFPILSDLKSLFTKDEERAFIIATRTLRANAAVTND